MIAGKTAVSSERFRHPFFLIVAHIIAAIAMMATISHIQYFPQKPCSATGGVGAACTAGGAETGCSIGAGAGADTGAATSAGATSTGLGGGATLTLRCFLTTCLGAGVSTAATGAGGGAAVVASWVAAGGVAVCAATGSFLVAHADNAKAESSKATLKIRVMVDLRG
jgi:hypothetical protein